MIGAGLANNPDIVAVLGATGSGKSTWLKREFLAPAPARLLIWDFGPLDEYSAYGQPLALRELVQAAYRCHKRGLSFALIFKPQAGNRAVLERQFSVMCNLALALGNLTLLVEELKYVTQPSRAPDAWARCVMTGRKVGLQIVATSQRPAHIDKDFLGNATRIHCGRLVYPGDIKAVADAMICEPADVQALDYLDWIEADARRALTRGRLEFSGGARINTPKRHAPPSFEPQGEPAEDSDTAS